MKDLKKLLAALLAVSMMMSFTACGSSDDDDNEDEDNKTTSSAASSEEDDASSADGTEVSEADEDSSEAEEEDTSSEAEEEASSSASDEESEADDESTAESTADSAAEVKLVDGVLQGTGYTLEVDESKWTDMSDSVSTVDCAFSFTGESENVMAATGNFNVISQSAGTYGDVTAEEYGEIVEEQYGSIDGYTVGESKAAAIGDLDGWYVQVDVEQSSMVMVMAQYIFVEDGQLYCLSYGAEESVFDELEPEFETVINTFKLA